jgi:hypothetical protein
MDEPCQRQFTKQAVYETNGNSLGEKAHMIEQQHQAFTDAFDLITLALHEQTQTSIGRET